MHVVIAGCGRVGSGLARDLVTQGFDVSIIDESPDAFHLRSLAGHLRDTRSAASRRSYEQALAEMRNTGYVLFREERPVAR